MQTQNSKAYTYVYVVVHVNGSIPTYIPRPTPNFFELCLYIYQKLRYEYFRFRTVAMLFPVSV